MIDRIRCFFGFHEWGYWLFQGASAFRLHFTRKCRVCGFRQRKDERKS